MVLIEMFWNSLTCDQRLKVPHCFSIGALKIIFSFGPIFGSGPYFWVWSTSVTHFLELVRIWSRFWNWFRSGPDFFGPGSDLFGLVQIRSGFFGPSSDLIRFFEADFLRVRVQNDAYCYRVRTPICP